MAWQTQWKQDHNEARKMRRDGDKKMSKILSEKQKEVLMQARKSGKAYDLMQVRKNSSHLDFTEIIKGMDKLGKMQVEETDPLENWHAGVEAVIEEVNNAD